MVFEETESRASSPCSTDSHGTPRHYRTVLFLFPTAIHILWAMTGFVHRVEASTFRQSFGFTTPSLPCRGSPPCHSLMKPQLLPSQRSWRTTSLAYLFRPSLFKRGLTPCRRLNRPKSVLHRTFIQQPLRSLLIETSSAESGIHPDTDLKSFR